MNSRETMTRMLMHVYFDVQGCNNMLTSQFNTILHLRLHHEFVKKKMYIYIYIYNTQITYFSPKTLNSFSNFCYSDKELTTFTV